MKLKGTSGSSSTILAPGDSSEWIFKFLSREVAKAQRKNAYCLGPSTFDLGPFHREVAKGAENVSYLGLLTFYSFNLGSL